MKKLIKSYKFWVSLAGALGILAVTINKHFGISINAKGVEETIMAICGVLIVFGIVKKDKTKESSQNVSENNSQDTTEKTNQNLQNETEDTNKNSLEK